MVYRQTVGKTQMDVSFSSLVLLVNSSMENTSYLVCFYDLYSVQFRPCKLMMMMMKDELTLAWR